MGSWILRNAIAAAIGAGCLGAAAHAETLYAITPDSAGIGRVFRPVAPAGTGTALGDGTVQYTGGIAYSTRGKAMYAVANDARGLSSLTSFSLTNPSRLSSPVSLGAGFTGGLAYDTDTASLFAIAADPSGGSTLYSVGAGGASVVGAIGLGFVAGLTYDSDDHNFYAIAGRDGLATSEGRFATVPGSFSPTKVCRIGLSGGMPVVTTLFDLGDDDMGLLASRESASATGITFLGGIAFDPTTKRLLTVGSDSEGHAAVYSFTMYGIETLQKVTALDDGFVNAALAFAPDAGAPISSVPEPSTTALLLAGAAGLVAVGRRRAVGRPIIHSV